MHFFFFFVKKTGFGKKKIKVLLLSKLTKRNFLDNTRKRVISCNILFRFVSLVLSLCIDTQLRVKCPYILGVRVYHRMSVKAAEILGLLYLP